MTDFDPATTKIRRSRVGNIDSDRLHARRDRLGADVHLNPGQFSSRMDWAYKALELTAIETELEGRGEISNRYTASKHSSLPVEPPVSGDTD